MPSLTPIHRSDEASGTAFHNGLVTGALALVPSSASVYYAMRNYPKFVKATNWQSRTALVIMPGLFAFALSSESRLTEKMHEMAGDAEHGRGAAEWRERANSHRPATTSGAKDAERQLTELYRTSAENSGVRIVPGSSLGVHHRLSNYTMENPFKVLAAAGVPTVLYIFKGRSHQSHLQLQSKIMHTRVYGQFAVIAMLLGLMGFKSYMDEHGKFITEVEAENRVEKMVSMQRQLLDRLADDRERMAQRDRVLARAHHSDLGKLGHQQEDQRKFVSGEEAEAIVADAAEGGAAMKEGKKKTRSVSVESGLDGSVMATGH